MRRSHVRIGRRLPGTGAISAIDAIALTVPAASGTCRFFSNGITVAVVAISVRLRLWLRLWLAILFVLVVWSGSIQIYRKRRARRSVVPVRRLLSFLLLLW